MTLYELSFIYEDSANLLRQRMRELRVAEKAAESPAEKCRLKRRLAALDPLLREVRALTKHTRQYYDRGYYKDEKYSL